MFALSFRFWRPVASFLLVAMTAGQALGQRRVLYEPTLTRPPSGADGKNGPAPPSATAPVVPPNTAVLGKGPANIPPPTGYDPYAGRVVSTAPAVAPIGYAPPPAMSAAPYTMSTAPAPTIPYGTPGAPYSMPYGYGGRGRGYNYGAALQGVASATAATGQYWQDIEQARITREQANQAHLDTRKKQIEAELWYESIKPTAPSMAAAQRKADLEWARDDAPRTEIWSGRTLNVLLQSILRSPAPLSGPNIALEPATMRGLNLKDQSTRGSLAMTKDDGKIIWTETLQDAPFDAVRNHFTTGFAAATRSVLEGEAPGRSTIKELRNDLKGMRDKLDDMVGEIPPGRYTESSRLLRQLNETVDGLANPRLVKSASASWKANVHTVRDLVGHCIKNGVEFGPALDGDEAAYTTAYYAIRAYERGVMQLASR
jgi:hypothetical protein